MDRAGKLRILVLTNVVRSPLGGTNWHPLQYALGLQRLGHDVWLLEDSDDYPSCYDPSRHVTDSDPEYGLRHATRVLAQLGLGERWAYHDAHRATWHGPASGGIAAICESADLLLNISGVNPIRPWLQAVPRRAYIDTDPAFTQVRNLTEPAHRALVLQHDSFFTFGENIADGTARVPDDGVRWQPTRQPVVLDLWPVTEGRPRGAFTTVLLWDSYRGREYGGVRYGMKAESFGPYLDLPRRSGRPLELAVGSPHAPRDLLRDHGWTVTDPLEVSTDPWTYQRYLAASRAEFTVAKHGYVQSDCGWFSERSAHYLASGRPVITQETGFSPRLPTGTGLLTFRSPEEALAALDDVDRRYHAHCRAARELAEAHFAAERVLASLIERALA